MVAAALAFVCFVVFGVAMRRFFVRPDGVRPAMQLIQLLGPPLAVAHFAAVLLRPPVNAAAARTGELLYGSAFALFTWAWATARTRVDLPLAFSRVAPAQVLASGPYAFCRHPFYLSYVMAWSAGAVYCGSVALALTAVLFLLLYLAAIRREERVLLASDVGPQYAAYRLRVGTFGPRIVPRAVRGHLLVIGTAVAFTVAAAIVIAISAALNAIGAILRSLPLRGTAIHLRARFNCWSCRWGLAHLPLCGPAVTLPTTGPALIVSNHVSWLDVFVIGAITPCVFVAKDDYRRGIGALILRGFGTIFISSDPSGDALRDTQRRVLRALAAGCSVTVFPEGTTTDGTSVERFHPAGFQAALEWGGPVLPLALRYSTPDGVSHPDVPWVRDVPFPAHIASLAAAPVPAVIHVSVGPVLSPWFRTRQQLAQECRAICLGLLGLEQQNRSSELPAAVAAGAALPDWFSGLLQGMFASGVLADPPDPRWTRATRLATTGIDSLAVATIAAEAGLPVRSIDPDATLGDLVEGSTGHPRSESLVARTICDEELLLVGRLRYEVFVDELGRPFPIADRRSRLLIDRLDRPDAIVGVFNGSALLATCRVTRAVDIEPSMALDRHLALSTLAESRHNVVVISRLAVRRVARLDPRVTALLLAQTCSVAAACGGRVMVAHTRAALTAAFARLGFRQHAEPYFDTDWGSWQLPMAASIDEIVRATAEPIAWAAGHDVHASVDIGEARV